MNDNKEKLKRMIEIAKLVLEHNPNDTSVVKGLQAMEEELHRISGEYSDKRKTNIGDWYGI